MNQEDEIGVIVKGAWYLYLPLTIEGKLQTELQNLISSYAESAIETRGVVSWCKTESGLPVLRINLTSSNSGLDVGRFVRTLKANVTRKAKSIFEECDDRVFKKGYIATTLSEWDQFITDHSQSIPPQTTSKD